LGRLHRGERHERAQRAVTRAIRQEAIDEVHRAAREGELDLAPAARVRRTREQLVERRRDAPRREAVHEARGVAAERQEAREADHRADAEPLEHVERHAQGIRVEARGRRRLRVQVHRHDREVDRLDAVARELELLGDALREREEQARADVIAAAGEDLPRAGHAARVAVLLEAEHAQAALRQKGRRREPVVARADDDHVVVVRAGHVGLAFQRSCRSCAAR
jgi:hypothetical protein